MAVCFGVAVGAIAPSSPRATPGPDYRPHSAD